MFIKQTMMVLAFGMMALAAQAQPLAQYTFDDGNAVDVTGNGYDGILLGIAPDPNDPNDPNLAAEVVIDPNRGAVLKVNRKGMQAMGPFDISTSFTLSAWIKMDQPLVGRYFFGGDGWAIRADNQSTSARDWMEVRYPGTSFVDKFDTRTEANPEGQLDGQWHHYVIVVEESGKVMVYLDGVPAPARDGTEKAHVYEAGVNTIFFGTENANGGNAIQGYMDDIRVYNYAVGEDAIPGLMGQLLVRYTFDDGTARDVSGNTYDGILLGIAPDPNDPNDPNVIAEVVLDDQGDGYLKVNRKGLQANGPFNISDSFTLAAWIQMDQPLQGRFFFGGDGWQIRADNQSSSARDWIEFRYPGGSFVDKFDTRTEENPLGQLDGQWHHYACVLDASGKIAIYFDGVAAPSRDGKTKAYVYEAGVNTIFFGSDNPNGSNAIQGAMDDIRVYNVALSEEDVQLMINPAGGDKVVDDPNGL